MNDNRGDRLPVYPRLLTFSSQQAANGRRGESKHFLDAISNIVYWSTRMSFFFVSMWGGQTFVVNRTNDSSLTSHAADARNTSATYVTVA
jgi:hypothetical protein